MVLENTINTLELVQREVIDLFGENSEADGFLATRNEYLHQFSILAATLHQNNTIRWIQSSTRINKLFLDEIEAAESRTEFVQSDTIESIRQKMQILEITLEKLSKNETLVDQFIALFSQMSMISEDKNSGSNKYLVTNPKSQQRILFNLEEIRSKILVPTDQILRAELSAGDKVLDLFESPKLESKEEISKEEIARVCELISWGFETTSSLDKIQELSNEISSNLKTELGTLRHQLIYFGK